jgi:signal transduction histidine kinase
MAQHRDPGAPFEVLRPGGNWTLVSELRLPDGAIVALGTDVSALKRAEAELHRARDELERRVAERTAELEAANRALRQENAERERVVAALRASEAQLRQAQKMDAMGQLTGGIAHDFNNLLTVILGSLDLLGLEVDAKSEARAYLDEARHAVAHGSLLTQHLLAFARRQALSPRPTDVNALITSFAPILQRTLGASIEVVTELDPALWPATVDRAQLENVLLNLALNARDASPSGGRIGIATGNVAIGAAEAATLDEVAAGAYVQLSMRDAGEGMAPEVLAHAVEPFFTTKEVGMGSGLGLSMVFGFVMQSQGHMQIDSAPGAGTTVTLYLPRAEAPAVAAAATALS